jgi:hypothetical protein
VSGSGVAVDATPRAARGTSLSLSPWRLIEEGGWLSIASICAGLATAAIWVSSGAPMICH